MHSLQELHHETLKTLGATFICSVLDLGRKERKKLSGSSLGLGCIGFQETWYTFIRMFPFFERSPRDARRRKVFNFLNENKLERPASHHHPTVCVTGQRKDFSHKSCSV